ncbi:unnamed protein product [Acanthoscelides obtectus]|uniref:cGMP-dependent protein kinase interacting domain-containing protein n=1 Tax=Acanthoscelides obtectus TaxID=200917 RepID=A0A9P0NRF6_ACAOB|nr:unnamed protein product [Acanthoscelides obtectus]CAK1634793.1 Protein phosphatase 1 regulatory subunit 12A [Acanthoscelides obtectus]
MSYLRKHHQGSSGMLSSSTPTPPSRTHRSQSRPRSHYGGGVTSSSYSSPYSSWAGPGSHASSASAYQSPYFPNGYRGSAGGYASLAIPAKSVLQTLSKKYENASVNGGGAHVSRRDRLGRAGSYRERSLSRSSRASPLSSTSMGSRSISLTSLNSEGYVSGSERSSRSRLNSTSDIRNENGEIDYKKLYEQQLAENDRLKDKLRKSEEELRDTKQTLEKLNVVTSKNSLSELEKRERRAMERKLSEMEEELKNLENLRSENQRLKDENGALIRVISKLSK